jgi:hypothetical protein
MDWVLMLIPLAILSAAFYRLGYASGYGAAAKWDIEYDKRHRQERNR